MKKLLILIVLILPVIILTGCEGEKEKITLADPVFGYETVFKYDKKENYNSILQERGGASNSVSFKNRDLDVEFQMYYTKMSKDNYNNSKKIRLNQKYYQEYKFGKYEAYSYGSYSSGLYLNILLGVDNNTAKALFVSIDRIDNNESVVVKDVLDKELMEFFNSIEVNSIDQ